MENLHCIARRAVSIAAECAAREAAHLAAGDAAAAADVAVIGQVALKLRVILDRAEGVEDARGTPAEYEIALGLVRAERIAGELREMLRGSEIARDRRQRRQKKE